MNTDKRIIVNVDFTANAAYVQLSDNEVVTSREVTDEVLVDLDKYNVVVGIEFLRIDAEIPFQKLIDDFHVHSAVVESLRSLRPSIGGKLQSMSEGSTSTQRSGSLVTA